MWFFNSTVYRRHCKCRRIKDQRTEPLYAAAVSKSFAEMPSPPSFSADSLFFVSLCRLIAVYSHPRQYRYRRHLTSRPSYHPFKKRVSSEFGRFRRHERHFCKTSWRSDDRAGVCSYIIDPTAFQQPFVIPSVQKVRICGNLTVATAWTAFFQNFLETISADSHFA